MSTSPFARAIDFRIPSPAGRSGGVVVPVAPDHDSPVVDTAAGIVDTLSSMITSTTGLARFFSPSSSGVRADEQLEAYHAADRIAGKPR